MTTAANALVVMAKAPQPGESKTRLVPPLTFEEAAELARALLIDQIDHLAEIDTAGLFIAFWPENSRSFFEELMPARFSCFPQEGQDLGERMRQAFESLFARGFGNIVLIGSDLPPIPLQTFDAAYTSLSSGLDVVLGPSEDGGYYLVGMSRLVVDIFEGIRWSRADVLDRTLEKINQANLSYEILAPWHDIDTPADLVRLYSAHQASAFFMKNSAAVLHELRQRGKL